MCNIEKARIINKTGSGVPTVPSSTDHTDGTWIATDIYEGESYLDTDTGILYTRSGSNIQYVGGGGGNVTPKIWKAQVYQSGTSAPVLNVLVNTLGVTITPSYVSAGTYLLSGFDSNLTGQVAMENSCPTSSIGITSFFVLTSSTARLSTRTLLDVYTDSILPSGKALSQIITVIKYD